MWYNKGISLLPYPYQNPINQPNRKKNSRQSPSERHSKKYLTVLCKAIKVISIKKRWRNRPSANTGDMVNLKALWTGFWNRKRTEAVMKFE
jgi:hypothetical protein